MKHSLSGTYEHSSSLPESQKHKRKDAIYKQNEMSTFFQQYISLLFSL